jgi:hypothetical protein
MDKPTYYFKHEPLIMGNVAYVLLCEPRNDLDTDFVRTSKITRRFTNGSFETLNSIYRPETMKEKVA